MVEKKVFHDLKLKLAEYLYLHPVVWKKLSRSVRVTTLQPGAHFIRETGSIIFIAEGLLKEYDAQHRIKPVIINFISSGYFIVTARHHQHRYLRASLPVTLMILGFDEALDLYFKHRELLLLYRAIAANYEAGILFRYALIEERFTEKKISLFIERYKPILPFLKKKDIANYLHIEYDYFIRLYGRML